MEHIRISLHVGYEQMDQKESLIHKRILQLDSPGDFIAAVREGSIEKCKQILEKRPNSILLKDRKGRFQSAAHVACENNDLVMLRFLKEQNNMDFDMEDIDGETPLYEAIDEPDLDKENKYKAVDKDNNVKYTQVNSKEMENLQIVKFLIEECGVNIDH